MERVSCHGVAGTLGVLLVAVDKSILRLTLRRALTEKMKTMPDGQLKQTFQKMLSYDNVPIKPKTFKNFCKNSFNLQRNEALVEQMWVEFEPLVRKPPPAAKPAAPQQAAPAAVAASKQAAKDGATKKRSRSDEESDAKAAKKAKKAAKGQALAVLEGLSREQLDALIAGVDAGIDLGEELQKAIAASAKETDGEQNTETKSQSEEKKKESKKKEKKEKKSKAKKEKKSSSKKKKS